jgi:hypothetical protein
VEVSILDRITEELLQEVLYCPKVTVRAERKKMTLSNRHKKNTVYLTSEDGRYEYKLFLRQSDEFLEDFSVGLIWTNPMHFIDISKNSVILLRCQGPHDGKEPLGADIHHDYHIHQITMSDFEARRYQKPSGRTVSSEFSSFEQAIFYFINTYHVKDIEKYMELPEGVNQTSLF